MKTLVIAISAKSHAFPILGPANDNLPQHPTPDRITAAQDTIALSQLSTLSDNQPIREEH